MQINKVYTIQIAVRSRGHEPRGAQTQKCQSTKQYRTFDRSRPHRTQYLTSFGKFRSIPRRNKKIAKQKSSKQRNRRRRLGFEKEAKRRNRRQTSIQVGRTLHCIILKQARILPLGGHRRKRTTAFLECRQSQKV